MKVNVDFGQVGSTSSARHHDSKIVCHLRHRHRVRSPPDRGDRPARGSSLSNHDSQPAKTGESRSYTAITFGSKSNFGVSVFFVPVTLQPPFRTKRVQTFHPQRLILHIRQIAGGSGFVSAGVCTFLFIFFSNQFVGFVVFRFFSFLLHSAPQLSGMIPKPVLTINYPHGPGLCTVQLPLDGFVQHSFRHNCNQHI